MALRPLSVLGLLVLVLACAGCGGSSSSAPPVATPHLAETEVVSAARSGGGDLQLAWAKALRVATAADASEFELRAHADDQPSQPQDWYLVQACSFGGSAHAYWSNPVAHRVVGAPAGGGSCDANAAWPPPAPPTGNECMDSWNAWIGHAPLNYRSAAAAAREAFAGRLDGKCIVVLSSDGEGVTLMQGPTGWALFDNSATPASPNAIVHADGTIEPRR